MLSEGLSYKVLKQNNTIDPGMIYPTLLQLFNNLGSKFLFYHRPHWHQQLQSYKPSISSSGLTVTDLLPCPCRHLAPGWCREAEQAAAMSHHVSLHSSSTIKEIQGPTALGMESLWTGEGTLRHCGDTGLVRQQWSLIKPRAFPVLSVTLHTLPREPDMPNKFYTQKEPSMVSFGHEVSKHLQVRVKN